MLVLNLFRFAWVLCCAACWVVVLHYKAACFVASCGLCLGCCWVFVKSVLFG